MSPFLFLRLHLLRFLLRFLFRLDERARGNVHRRVLNALVEHAIQDLAERFANRVDIAQGQRRIAELSVLQLAADKALNELLNRLGVGSGMERTAASMVSASMTMALSFVVGR